MCGIIAISGKNTNTVSDVTVSKMLVSLSKRGPDESDFVREKNCILGQARLSIVDIGGGHQPMKDTDAHLTLVFNGEIYGYKQSRKELEALGHTFATNSDTEVILKAYKQYGKDCVDHLDGMFAFALWDAVKQEMFIARDRFGKKPFYYTFVDGTFFAASEIKALFATDMIKGSIDNSALNDYLRLMYVPAFKSIYSNISVLPPAHAGIVTGDKITTWQYWKISKKKKAISYEDAKKEIKRLFAEAVEKRMVADVEIGSLLSGGIDSTIITQEAQKYMNRPIKTFSVGFGSSKNELPYAEQASKQIGTDHYTLVTDTVNFSNLEEVITYFDEPHADTSNFPQALVSKLSASKVKVALTGDGADELFMGYGWYQKYWNTPFLKRILSNPWKSYLAETHVFTSEEIQALTGKKISKNPEEYIVIKGLRNAIEKINAFDIQIYLPGQLLSKVDRTSMMHSLEIRSPFLDTALAEFVYSLPTHYKLSRTGNKIILKDILAETFPADFVYRRKQGFGAPLTAWLENPETVARIQSILNDSNRPIWKYISQSYAQEMQRKALGNTKKYGLKLWSLISLALWFDSHAQFHDK